jgi:NADPH:quinone reductase-like Zn-dependent oxidoreductase
MESLPSTYSALVREDSEGKQIGLKSYPLPKDIPANHVLVKVAYAPINPSDWMYFLKNAYGNAEDMTPPPSVAGFEGSGTVVGLGEGVDNQLKGAKVAFLLDKSQTSFWGTWSEYTIIPKTSLITFLEETPLEDIHSCFVNPATVFAMGELFDPEKGGVAVFNAGGSSLCRMAIRYFKERNIKTIMIVRREAHVEELKKEGADWVINSKDEKYMENLKSVFAEAKPVTFFDAVAGPDAMEVLQAMPNGSTLYNYGALSLKPLDASPIDLIFRNKTIT